MKKILLFLTMLLLTLNSRPVEAEQATLEVVTNFLANLKNGKCSEIYDVILSKGFKSQLSAPQWLEKCKNWKHRDVNVSKLTATQAPKGYSAFKSETKLHDVTIHLKKDDSWKIEFVGFVYKKQPGTVKFIPGKSTGEADHIYVPKKCDQECLAVNSADTIKNCVPKGQASKIEQQFFANLQKDSVDMIGYCFLNFGIMEYSKPLQVELIVEKDGYAEPQRVKLDIPGNSNNEYLNNCIKTYFRLTRIVDDKFLKCSIPFTATFKLNIKIKED